MRSDANGPRFEAKPCAASGASGARVGVRAWLLHQSETDAAQAALEESCSTSPLPSPSEPDRPSSGEGGNQSTSYFMPVSFA